MPAQTYIDELNARMQARAAEEGLHLLGRLRDAYPDEETGLDVAWNLAEGEYSDAHKAAFGFRPRPLPVFFTLDEIEEETRALYEQASRDRQ